MTQAVIESKGRSLRGRGRTTQQSQRISESNGKFLSINRIYRGDARKLLPKIRPQSVALSVWSPPYFVGKKYEANLNFADWQSLLARVIALHFPIIKPGGFLVVPARCEEGAGDGVGEQRFLAAMRDAPDVQFILDDARRRGYPPGQQRAFVMAKVLEQARVVIVGSEYPDVVAACKMIPAATVEDALSLAARELGENLDVLVVPHALLTLPVVTES